MKYHNHKTEFDGILFDSKKEAMRYAILRSMEQIGEIKDLRRQVKYTLIEGKRWSNGKKHRDTVYIADFVYRLNGRQIVEDVKGFRTPEYKLKRELMKDRYNIEIQEV